MIEIPTLTFAAGLLRDPQMFQICLAATDFPIGMIALLASERWPARPDIPSVFAWYLTGAPAAAVIAHGAPKLLMAAALDVAVTVSLNGPAEGRLWLHADRAGGARLAEWYDRRGLARMPADIALPSATRLAPRRNDGRYYWLTPDTARGVSQRMDEFRN